MVSVQFLGTASGLPAVDRFGQTTVLTHDAGMGSRHILLDVGDGAASLLRRHGYDFLAIQALAISHLHGDHHGGFVQVIKTMMHLGRQDDLTVLAPSEGIDGLRQYLEVSYLIEELLGFHIEWVPLTHAEGQSVSISDDFSLAAFRNEHLGWTRRRLAGRVDLPRVYLFESYSFVLKVGGSRIVYSGNLDGPTGADELATFVDPCDLLICELAHLDPAHLGAFISQHEVHAVALAHFHPKWDNVPASVLLDLMESESPGLGSNVPVVFARDGEEVEVHPVGKLQ